MNRSIYLPLILIASGLLHGAAAGGDEPRLITAIRRDMSNAMQSEVRARNAADDKGRAAAIYDLTQLYNELKRDPRLPLSDTLQTYKAELWSRLSRIQTQLQRRFSREAKAKRPASDALGSPATHQASRSLASHVDLVAASLGGPIGLLGHTRYGSGDPEASSSAGKTPGASAAIGGRGGAAGPPDFGPALVELIQRTIAPDSWDVNGGPGTIVYYPAFHCLVVRASGEVHEAIGGVLGGLGR